MLSVFKLRDLCRGYWNPIGVPMKKSIPHEGEETWHLPADEYDNYLSHMQTLLDRGASEAEVVGYLEVVEREYLGLSNPAGDKAAFVKAVVDQRKQSEF